MDSEFKTDGCSVVNDLDMRACCIRHDWAYWKGGSRKDRRKADRDFFNCIWKTSRFPILAPIRWFGVRIGGKKFWNAPGVSWNYGWKDFTWRDKEGPFSEQTERPKLLAALGQSDEKGDAALSTHA